MMYRRGNKAGGFSLQADTPSREIRNNANQTPHYILKCLITPVCAVVPSRRSDGSHE